LATATCLSRYARDHPLGVASADPIQGFAGHDVEIPGLAVHRGWRAHRQTDDFLDQGPRHRIRLVAADAAAAEDNVIKLHGSGIASMVPMSRCSRHGSD
jgi:hypothetical protein